MANTTKTTTKANTTKTTTVTTATVTATSSAEGVSSAQTDAYTNVCPDGHACDNDSTCVESLLQESKYVCDCHDSYINTGRVFSGLSCQHVATEFCTTTGEISHIAYCVNKGQCLKKIDPTATTGGANAHPGCSCPRNYEGEHCQYITGSTPDEMSYFLDGTTFAARFIHPDGEGPGFSPVAIVVPILLVTFAALGYVLWKYRGLDLVKLKLSGWRNKEDPHVIDKTKTADENMLDANGDTVAEMRGQFKYQGRRNSTPSFSTNHKTGSLSHIMDPPDFDDLLEQSDHVQFHMDHTGSASHKLFASDPNLTYNPTVETTGTGSQESSESNNDDGTGAGAHLSPSYAVPGDDFNEDLDNSPTEFEEYDPSDFSTRGVCKPGVPRFDDPTFTWVNAEYSEAQGRKIATNQIYEKHVWFHVGIQNSKFHNAVVILSHTRNWRGSVSKQSKPY